MYHEKKEETHIIISIDSEKAFYKIYFVYTLSKDGIEASILFPRVVVLAYIPTSSV
jgi:hypothetical protein